MGSHRKPRPAARLPRAARRAADLLGVAIAGALSLTALHPTGHPAPTAVAARPDDPSALSRADQLSAEADQGDTAAQGENRSTKVRNTP